MNLRLRLRAPEWRGADNTKSLAPDGAPPFEKSPIGASVRALGCPTSMPALTPPFLYSDIRPKYAPASAVMLVHLRRDVCRTEATVDRDKSFRGKCSGVSRKLRKRSHQAKPVDYGGGQPPPAS